VRTAGTAYEPFAPDLWEAMAIVCGSG